MTTGNKARGYLAGVKGWLLFYTVILVIMLISSVSDMMTNLVLLRINTVEKIIYRVAQLTLVSLLMSASVIWILLKLRIAPLIVIIMEAFRMGITVMQVIDSNKNIEDWIVLCFGLVWGCLWIAYFIRSKRVANTFEN
ncbi:hypothetical protein J2T15_004092 [Paenibacillus harenae]|uniref:DUF2569 family protein n=1 Tax=Paenibacillus harenae TaxID=306543 RepID=A0ABT9U4R8_PAEHA|nr:hypothetical protein [Paenibacillus harenae]MDQ0114636.1 hypothetical protein [Paenibacillus harenae]